MCLFVDTTAKQNVSTDNSFVRVWDIAIFSDEVSSLN